MLTEKELETILEWTRSTKFPGSLEDSLLIGSMVKEILRLRELCGAAYQLAGTYDAPVEALDNLAAAAAGKPLPHEVGAFLPLVNQWEEQVERLTKVAAQAEIEKLKAENKDGWCHHGAFNCNCGSRREAAEKERDQARAEVERRKLEGIDFDEERKQRGFAEAETKEWKRRAEELQGEVGRLTKEVSHWEASWRKAVTERQEAAAEVERLKKSQEAAWQKFVSATEDERFKMLRDEVVSQTRRAESAEAKTTFYEIMSRQNLGVAKEKLERVWELERQTKTLETTLKENKDLREALEEWVHWAFLEYGKVVSLSQVGKDYDYSVKLLGGECQCEHCTAKRQRGE